ncbi:BTAD domain-containing putative transcriptional regulator [Lentzea sp. NPDC034063]|uniref:BTAD domain-containing putative transcriptional regulator n=1 Tax=unclassified Lentzea TaxID=2643253 RepID=UPI0034008C29
MRFGVLGPLAVWDEAGEPVTVPELKVRALLAALIAHDGAPVAVDALVQHLWGDRPPGKPAGALQVKISQLRGTLGRDRIVRQPPGYRLVLGAEDLDATRFRALVARARSTADPRSRAALFTEALDLWRGAAYADFADDEFVRPAAHHLTELRLAVVEERANAWLEAGDHALAVGELATVVPQHPLREGLRATQLRALYLTGRQSEALTSYEDLRGRLAEELGVDPSPELRALHQAMLRQELVSPQGKAPSNLPSALTPLIGRERSLAQLAELHREARLVTLTGPGGVGKSSLAIAHAGSGEFPDGVWLVEFAGLRTATAADLAEVVAAVLGISDSGTGEAARRLATALRDRRMLLVLDNCEHVVDAAAELTELLLRAARGLVVVTTSQEPLGLAGERVFDVEPLPPPDAIRLFLARAAASAPGFPSRQEDCDPADLDAVAEICRRLDGIPLALELAATRVRALGVRELAVRLADRFSVLTLGQRGAPARQRTLRAMIDWSWELLSAPERVVLRRLAVHSDGCDLAAAEEVCAGDGVARAEVLDLVTRLVDRSLVVVTQGPRYRLLESVSAYALERLQDAADLARDRHLRHYLAVAEHAEPQLRGSGQQVWLARLDAEAGNMRAALEHAGPGEAVRLVTALSWWWLLRGRLAEGRRTLAAVLSTCATPELVVLHAAFALLNGDHEAAPVAAAPARAQWLCAYGLFSAGNLAVSTEVNTRALDLFTAEDDQWGIAAALGLRAMLALVRGDLAALGRDGRHSAELFRRLGDRWGEMQTIPPLATLAEIKGDYESAARCQHEGLAIAQELGLQAEVSARLSGLGRLALLDRDWERAHDLHQRAHRIAVEHGYTYGQIHAKMGLALGARRCGDLDAAEEHLRQIRDDYADLSSLAGDHLLHAELGFIAELRGDARQSAVQHLQSLDLARSLNEPRALALSLEGLAGAAALRGDECAALLLGAADTARRSVDAPLPPAERGDVDRVTEAARSALGDTAFSLAFDQGTRLTVEEAAAMAPGAGDLQKQDAPAEFRSYAPPR